MPVKHILLFGLNHKDGQYDNKSKSVSHNWPLELGDLMIIEPFYSFQYHGNVLFLASLLVIENVQFLFFNTPRNLRQLHGVGFIFPVSSITST